MRGNLGGGSKERANVAWHTQAGPHGEQRHSVLAPPRTLRGLPQVKVLAVPPARHAAQHANQREVLLCALARKL